jgi:general secretion pathway protein D
LLPVLAALLVSGCAGQAAFHEARALAEQDKLEAALLKFREAVDADPSNANYRAAFLRARDGATRRLVEQGDRHLADGQSGLAEQAYRRVLTMDPAHERARAGMRLLEADARHASMLDEAKEAFGRKEYEVARQRLQAILAERPSHEPARLLLAEVVEKSAAPDRETGLAQAYKQPISIEFRDAPLKQIFEVISRRSGLNFLFDRDVKTDARTSIFLKNSTVEAAVYYLLVTNQLEQQVMDANTVLVYPNIAAKQREYQEMVVKTFFLANAEAKTVANTLKVILKSRDVVVDEKLNLIIVRDHPEAIKLATRLIALQDVAEPEVMLEVEILEIKRSRLLELGVAWPTKLGFAPLTTTSSTGAAVPLSIDTLRGLNSRSIGVTGVGATINADKTDGDSNTLANPRIRVRNKEKAKVVIGEKVPSITTTVSAGTAGFAQESINYLDVGLTLNVEPTIYLNNEVAIRIALQVSNLIGTITSPTGSTAYQIGTREATTMLQLKDGENQVLAGLINNEDRSNGTKVPLLGDLPVVGRLFGSNLDENDKTEIVLSITPHLIRNIQRPAASAAEFNAGTEATFRRRPDARVAPVSVSPSTAPSPLPALPLSAPVQAPPAAPATPATPAAPAAQGTPGQGQTQGQGVQPGVTVTPVPTPVPVLQPAPAPVNPSPNQPAIP